LLLSIPNVTSAIVITNKACQALFDRRPHRATNTNRTRSTG
jgi:hypothetical protein